jgi:hypothetical protein
MTACIGGLVSHLAYGIVIYAMSAAPMGAVGKKLLCTMMSFQIPLTLMSIQRVH